ncbi:MAG: hypothetical protein QG636_545 [Patescibacteria group bacterium]|nr:hypothetical protein [Patescibacteria group bacterium]
MDQNNQQPQVTFENEEFQRPVTSSQTQTPGIVGWVVKCSGGLIKNEKQAQYVLVGFLVVAIVFVAFLIFSSGGTGAKFEAPPGQKIIYPENEPPRLEQKF